MAAALDAENKPAIEAAITAMLDYMTNGRDAYH
jgi:hypothetical protein